MKILVEKMSKLGLLIVYIVLGALVMAGAVLLMPIGLLATDPSLLLNPYILGVILIAMLGFGLVGYFVFVRQYVVYRKTPTVQLEADNEFLYFHGKKEAKIPLSSLSDSIVYVDLPYILQKEFIAEFIVQKFSNDYGTVTLEVPEYGTFKMPYVAHAKEVGDRLIDFINQNSKIEL